MAQLLIDLPAESASRLLTLSLLEQLSVHGPYVPGPSAGPDVMRDSVVEANRRDAYRAALNRLRGCIALYHEMLSESIPRKVRRRLRAIAKAANALHDVDVQLGWLTRIDRAGQGTLAAQWLRDRLARRHERLGLRLAQVQEDTRPLQRLAKRLSVFTTAIHLDELNVSLSFAALTGQRLIGVGATLHGLLANVSPRDDARALRRVCRASDHVVYLLEPVRVSAGAEPLTGMAYALRSALERLHESGVVVEALVEGARRIGAVQMMTRVRRAAEPCDHPGENGDALIPMTSSVLPDEVAPGLVSLAERVRDERAQSFAGFASQWTSPAHDTFFAELERLIGALGTH